MWLWKRFQKREKANDQRAFKKLLYFWNCLSTTNINFNENTHKNVMLVPMPPVLGFVVKVQPRLASSIQPTALGACLTQLAIFAGFVALPIKHRISIHCQSWFHRFFWTSNIRITLQFGKLFANPTFVSARTQTIEKQPSVNRRHFATQCQVFLLICNAGITLNTISYGNWQSVCEQTHAKRVFLCSYFVICQKLGQTMDFWNNVKKPQIPTCIVAVWHWHLAFHALFWNSFFRFYGLSLVCGFPFKHGKLQFCRKKSMTATLSVVLSFKLATKVSKIVSNSSLAMPRFAKHEYFCEFMVVRRAFQVLLLQLMQWQARTDCHNTLFWQLALDHCCVSGNGVAGNAQVVSDSKNVSCESRFHN